MRQSFQNGLGHGVHGAPSVSVGLPPPRRRRGAAIVRANTVPAVPGIAVTTACTNCRQCVAGGLLGAPLCQMIRAAFKKIT